MSTSDGALAAQQQLNNAKLGLTQANAGLAGTVVAAPVVGRVLLVGGTGGSRVSPGGTGFGGADQEGNFVVLRDVSSLTVRAGQSATVLVTTESVEDVLYVALGRAGAGRRGRHGAPPWQYIADTQTTLRLGQQTLQRA